MKIKLLKKGIRVDGQYFPAWYSPSESSERNWASIFLKTSKRFPAEAAKELGFTIKNDTDLMTDYFENDTLRVPSENQYFKTVEELAKKS